MDDVDRDASPDEDVPECDVCRGTDAPDNEYQVVCPKCFADLKRRSEAAPSVPRDKHDDVLIACAVAGQQCHRMCGAVRGYLTARKGQGPEPHEAALARMVSTLAEIDAAVKPAAPRTADAQPKTFADGYDAGFKAAVLSRERACPPDCDCDGCQAKRFDRRAASPMRTVSMPEYDPTLEPAAPTPCKARCPRCFHDRYGKVMNTCDDCAADERRAGHSSGLARSAEDTFLNAYNLGFADGVNRKDWRGDERWASEFTSADSEKKA